MNISLRESSQRKELLQERKHKILTYLLLKEIKQELYANHKVSKAFDI